MARFRRAFKKLAPSWLTTGEGELVLYSLGLIMDSFAERMRLSLQAKMPTHAPTDALSRLGRDRKIVRGINEPAAAYSARLLRYLDDHRVRGNPYALMDQLAEYCQADVMIRTVDRRGNWYTRERDGSRSVLLDQGNWDWDGTAVTQWSRFWVIIYPTSAGEPWSQQTQWGSTSRTTGTTATTDQIASVKSIVREWKPAGTKCEWIIIAYDDTTFDPTDPTVDPSGDWAAWGLASGATYLPIRETTARYWVGPR